MEQIKISPDLVVPVEYIGAATLLKPTVFKEGELFCCILGPDAETGVFGCGDTPSEALEDWDDSLRIRLKEADNDDQIVIHVKEILRLIPKDQPKHIKEFYNQFRAVKKAND